MINEIKQIGIFLLYHLFFDCSQLVSSLGHAKKKSFGEKLFSGIQLTFIHLFSGHLANKFFIMFSIGGRCFKLHVTAWSVYVFIEMFYVSTQACPFYFKAMPFADVLFIYFHVFVLEEILLLSSIDLFLGLLLFSLK